MESLTHKSPKRKFFKESIFTVLVALVTVFACEVEEPIPTYTLITAVSPIEGGKIMVSPQAANYQEGVQVTLTPEPNENWVFNQWEGDGAGSTTPLQITMTSNKSITGVFVKRDYPLNIVIEGEGTVEEKIITNPSGREYPHGTTVELTPKPKEGWEFESWGGDLVGNESPKNIMVDKEKNVTVKFKEAVISYTEQAIVITSSKFSTGEVQQTMRTVSSAFIYNDNDGNIFSFHPGTPSLNQIAGPLSTETVPPVSSQILKKVNGQWEHFKEDDKALFWGARNFKIIGDKVVIGDGNELGSNSQEWKGNILYGKILSDGNIDWKTVNKPDEMGYFHGITMGDINKDGLMDFAGTPGINNMRLNVFVQESEGVFRKRDELININRFNAPPFTIEFADLFGDERDEIIIADYGGGTSPPDSDDHEISVYSFDSSTQKYELKFKDNYPNAYSVGLGATSIKVFDANNDGIKDISVAREDLEAHGFEIWLGKPDGTFQFSFSSPTWTSNEMQFREFQILDANNDGLNDIILIPFHFGSLFRNNAPCGPDTCEGVKLNHLIWLNNGDGTFEAYNKSELVVPNVYVHYLLPYKVGNYLHFVGTEALGFWPNYSSNYNLLDIKLKLD
ncbi:Repeat domain-containing protein [Belliella buryatensis]|uniref:Repeat domain-containing protein n=2 Tax=Belliella buryatensis TaxID=1500549 RepID=A0A239FLT1_9BACT|nr:Repeat domain-containing protein [Belliella buryatensis]